MKALITGASSGLGREMARLLAARGYELILCARREERLRELAAELPVPCRIIAADVSDEQECRLLYEAVQSEELEVVINNAGFGLFGEFVTADLDEELRMIDTNVRAVHILTKLAVRDFVQRGRGYILNVSSSAGFLPGPLMATYYATKNYVLRLTEALREELRRAGSPCVCAPSVRDRWTPSSTRSQACGFRSPVCRQSVWRAKLLTACLQARQLSFRVQP